MERYYENRVVTARGALCTRPPTEPARQKSRPRVAPAVPLSCQSKVAAMGEADYSFSLTTFSPSGKLVQIDYALNAVAAGNTSLGIKGEGLAVAVEIGFAHVTPAEL